MASARSYDAASPGTLAFSSARRYNGSKSEGFRLLSIFPTAADLKRKASIRPNKVLGGYESVDEYLDVQFRLLREDVFAPLRDGVQQYLKHIQLGLPIDQLKDVDVYTRVFIIGAAASRWGITYKIRFDASKKRKKLAQSKRLIFGSQVVLSADDFDTIYVATVQDNNSDGTIQGELEIAFEPRSARRIADIEFCSTEFVMVETAAYFEAYRHVLEGIKEIQPTQFPFQSYIVECDCTGTDPPKYLRAHSTYDLSSIAPTRQQGLRYLKNVPVLQPRSWPTADQLGLNQSQLEALQLALTREFAVIQGPPGTGKTFIGLKIVKILLANSGKLSSLEDMMASMHLYSPYQAASSPTSEKSPILVVCYTNHALDQFLEGILEFTPEGVIRVGSRSTSQKLQKCSLSKQDRNIIPHHKRSEFGEVRGAMLDERRAALADTHRATLSDRAIFKYSILEKYMQRNHARQIQTMNAGGYYSSRDLVDWLDLEHSCMVRSLAEDEPGHSFNDTRAFGEERKLELQHRLLDACDGDNFKITPDLEDHLHKIETEETSVNFYDFIRGSHAAKRTVRQDILRVVSSPANSRRLLYMLRTSKPLTAEEEARISDATCQDPSMKWRLYMTWVCRYRKALVDHLKSVCSDYDVLSQNLRELKTDGDVCMLQNAKVIGMTTTGAARMRHVLQEIKPRVVIVEEAAEVLEAHVVATLSSGCQHLILIGDHQQLRPNPTVYELAKTYKLDVSLFERMVNNNLPFKTLSTQHRMKPEFSAIMKNHFYSQLQDSSSVHNRENVRGMEHDMYYLTHSELEQQDFNQSYCNRHEADLVVAMCRYLLMQGYSAENITVLTPYNGQLALIRTKLMDTGEKIRVSSIDGYQGEENDIVLFSVVRSNEEDKLGFMNTTNRICVALSRARLGFYVFGNFAMVARISEFWRGILLEVEKKEMLGRDLALVCVNHQTKSLARSAIDFEQKCPDGGCLKPCTGHLKCGHPCPKKCHGIPDYLATWKCRSQVRCKEVFKTCKHQCPLRCCDPCPKQCTQPVSHRHQCGHIETIYCHQRAEADLCQPCSDAEERREKTRAPPARAPSAPIRYRVPGMRSHSGHTSSFVVRPNGHHSNRRFC